MDYPFNLKGILYFPKIGNEFDTIEGTIKLYNNQVYVADNIKEVIPEFLLLLKGVIDCPDLPLNVSRSFLQNDGFVKKISDYISKKVADKLKGLYNTDLDNYKTYWDDIQPFIKFGCLKDDKFDKKVKDCVLFKNLAGEHVTLKEYLEANKESHENKVFYVTDEQQQSQYIELFKSNDMDAVILNHSIDQHYVSHLEAGNENVKLLRIDSDISESMKTEVTNEDELKSNTESLQELFRKVLNNDKLEVKVESLKADNISSMMVLSEESRRMQDMGKMYGFMGMAPGMDAMETLVLNNNNNLVQYVLENRDEETKQADVNLFCEQLYDLAMISHKPLEADAMTKFIARSNEIMGKLAK